MELNELKTIRRVAVVGATTQEDKYGYIVKIFTGSYQF